MKCCIRRFNQPIEKVDIKNITSITPYSDCLVRVITTNDVILGYDITFEE